MKQRTDWQEFCDATGFGYTCKQMAFGAAMGAVLIGICMLVSWIGTFF